MVEEALRCLLECVVLATREGPGWLRWLGPWALEVDWGGWELRLSLFVELAVLQR